MPAALSLLEQYALQATPAARVTFLRSAAAVAGFDGRELGAIYVAQKQLEFIEKAYPASLQANGLKPPATPSADLAKELKALEEDVQYKAALKGWQSVEPEKRSSSDKAQMLRHGLIKWGAMNPASQAEWLEILCNDANLKFVYSKPYSSPQAEPARVVPQQADSNSFPQQMPPSERPSVLDPATLNLNNLDKLLKDRYENHGGLSAFERTPAANEWLAENQLMEQYELGQFMRQQYRPDVTNLDKIYVKAIKDEDSSTTFGSLPIDSMLSVEQLESLGSSISELKKSNATYLGLLFRKSVLPVHALSALTLEEKKTFYTALWKFAKEDLGDGQDDHQFLSLKARMYFACLTFDADELGVFNMDHFTKWLAIPRGWSHGEYALSYTHKSSGHRATMSNGGDQGEAAIVDKGGYFSGAGATAEAASEPIVPLVSAKTERELVERYLFNFYREQDNKWDSGRIYKFLPESYLKAVHARARLSVERLWNISDPLSKESKLYASYIKTLEENAPKQLKELAESSFVEFAPASFHKANVRSYADPHAAVSVTLVAKSIGKLFFSVFELNTQAYLSSVAAAGGEAVDPSTLSVEGLVPSTQFEVDLSSVASFQTVTREVALPSASASPSAVAGAPKRNGAVFLVEIVTSSGRKLRCVIQKGFLTALAHPMATGVALRVLDYTGRELRRASVAFNGHVYASDAKTGLILLPYAKAGEGGRRKQIVLSDAWNGATTAVAAGKKSPADEEEKKESSSSSPAGADGVVITHSPVSAPSFSCASSFLHAGCTYSWTVSAFVPREALLAKTKATLLLRVGLWINDGVSLPLSRLSQVQLTLDTEDAEGTKSSHVVPDFALDLGGGDSVHAFVVPDNLRLLGVSLTASVQDRSTGESTALSYRTQIEVNTAEDLSPARMESLFLRHGSDGWGLAILGRSGEPVAGKDVTVRLKHAFLTAPLEVVLASDERGEVLLGNLPFVTHVAAESQRDAFGVNSTCAGFLGASRRNIHASRFHVLRDTVLTIPYSHPSPSSPSAPVVGGKVSKANFALLQVVPGSEVNPGSTGSTGRGDAGPSVLRDLTSSGALALGGGEVGSSPSTLSLDTSSLEPGTYQLHQKDLLVPSDSSCAIINVVVAANPNKAPAAAVGSTTAAKGLQQPQGLVMSEYALERRRFVQVSPGANKASTPMSCPVQIVRASVEAEEALVQLALPLPPGVRVHVYSSHFASSTETQCDSYSRALEEPTSFPVPSTSRFSVPEGVYLKSKSLGDEAKYILDRVAAKKNAGNMLSKPGLLLNQRLVGDTHFEPDPELASEQSFDAADGAAEKAKKSREMLEKADKLEALSYGFAKKSMALSHSSIGDSFGGFGGGGDNRRQADMSVNYSAHYKQTKSGGGVRLLSALASGIVSVFSKKELKRGNVGSTHFTRPNNVRLTGGRSTSEPGEPSLEFLRRGAGVLYNLRPDAQGVVRVKRDQLGPGHTTLVVLAIDGAGNSAWMRVGVGVLRPVLPVSFSVAPAAAATPNALEGLSQSYRDLRLSPALDSNLHYRDQFLVELLGREGEQGGVPNAKENPFECFQSVPDAWRLLRTLAPAHVQSTLSSFSWVAEWATLSEEAKLQRYDQYACNEVHVFLHLRDRAFFDAVVRPLLAAKLAPGFVDDFVLGRDVRAWVEPKRFDSLIVPERVLLATRLPEPQARAVFQGIVDAVQSKPVNSALYQRLFAAALASRSMESDRPAPTLLPPAEINMPASAPCPPPSVNGQWVPDGAAGPSFASRMMARSRNVPQEREERKVARRSSVDDDDDGEVLEAELDGMGDFDDKMAEEEEAPAGASFADLSDSLASTQPRKFFSPPPTTKEIEERGWWGVSSSASPAQQAAQILNTPNKFWADRAAWGLLSDAERAAKGGRFISGNFFYAHSTFGEIVLTLAVLDLPFAPTVPASLTSRDGVEAVVTSRGGPVIVYSRQLKPIGDDMIAPSFRSGGGTLSVLSMYVDPSRPSQRVVVDGVEETQDLTIAEPKLHFQPCKMYKNRLILTNLSSNTLNIRALIQIPEGSLALCAPGKSGVALATSTILLSIPPFQSVIQESFFYFPALGSYAHYPAQLYNLAGRLVGAGAPRGGKLEVVRRGGGSGLSSGSGAPHKVAQEVDWGVLKAHGTDAEVLTYLAGSRSTPARAGSADQARERQNLFADNVRLDDVLWRCLPTHRLEKDVKINIAAGRTFWVALIELLRARQVFHAVTWSFALKFHMGAAGAGQKELDKISGYTMPPLVEHLSHILDPQRGPQHYLLSQAFYGSTRAGASQGYFFSPLVSFDSFGLYQDATLFAKEYSPLFNSRAHPLALIKDGGKHVAAASSAADKAKQDAAKDGSNQWQPIAIQNKELRAQYTKLLTYLVQRYAGLNSTSHTIRLVLTYYMLLQERVEDAKKLFATITVDGLRAELSCGAIAAPVSFATVETHVDFVCDGCEAQPIVGARWRCTDAACPNFDLCGACKAAGREVRTHTKAHVMKRLAVGGADFVEEKKEAVAPAAASSSSDAALSSLDSFLIQRDYLEAYLAFFESASSSGAGISRALAIAKRYQQFPVKKVREQFDEIERSVVESATNADPAELGYDQRVGLPSDKAGAREAEMEALAATEPFAEFAVDGKEVRVSTLQVNHFVVNFFKIDLELLFSTSPFLASTGSAPSSASGQKAATPAASSDTDSAILYVHPNASIPVDLRAQLEEAQKKAAADPRFPRFAINTRSVPIPEEFSAANVYVQLLAPDFPHINVSKVIYASGLSLSLTENYGTLKVRSREAEGKPAKALSKVYVKVYARLKSGVVDYYKDGYSDQRGQFDYASLSSDKLRHVERFSILVLSAEHGALVKQAKPPAQQ